VCPLKKRRGKEIDHAHGPPPSNPSNMEDKHIIHFMLEVSVGVLVCLLRLRLFLLLLLDPPVTTHKGRGPGLRLQAKRLVTSEIKH